MTCKFTFHFNVKILLEFHIQIWDQMYFHLIDIFKIGLRQKKRHNDQYIKDNDDDVDINDE